MGATRKSTPQNLQSFDLVDGLIVIVLGVKVGRQMVIEKHANHNAREIADARHISFLVVGDKGSAICQNRS
jgi:hypothetical protein